MNPSSPLAAVGLDQLVQIGFVVRDLEKSMAMYAPMFGPWQRIDGSVQGAEYRGRIEDVSLDIAFGHNGSLEIELIEWKSGHSPHREFIDSGREGMHHLQFRVADCDAWIGKLRPLGYVPIWYKKWSADTVFSYLERAADPLIIEFLQMPAGDPGA
jgi:methylmalonyl-CoA/ethylmalonyl-CoA epimerase